MKCSSKFNILVFLLSVVFTLEAQETEIYTERNVHFKEGLELVNQRIYLSALKAFEKSEDQTKKATDDEQKMVHMISQYYYAFCSYKLDLPNTELLYKNFINSYHESKYKRWAYFDLGTYYFNKKKTSEALKWYEKVNPRDLSKEDLTSYKFNMGYSLFKRKKFKEAKPYFKDIKNAQSDYLEPANYYYGFISFYNEDYQEAQKSFEALKESSLYKNVVPYYLVQIYFVSDEFQKTIDYGTPLLKDTRLKNLKEVQHIIGQAHFELGDFHKSIPLLKNYIDHAKKVSKEEMFQLAFAQYKTNQLPEAIKNLRPLSVVEDAFGQNAMYLLGNAYLKTNEKSLARDAFLTASSLDWDLYITELSAFQYAKLSYDLNFFNIATNSLIDFIEKYPNSEHKTESLNLVSNVLLKTKNYSRAIEIIENNNITGPKIDATYQKVTLFKGIELYNDKNFKEAEILANKSMKKNVNQDLKAQAIFLKGLIFYEQKDYSQAISAFSWFKQFKVFRKENWASVKLANYNIAYSNFKLKDYSKAATYFELALKDFNRINTSDRTYIADATLRYADCLLIIKSYEKALQNYDIVIDNNWRSKEYALLQKSVIYGLKGAFSSKISTLETLLRTYPNSTYAAESQFEIADAYLQLNNIPTSINSFNEFIKKYPNNQLMPEAFLKLGLLHSNAGNESKSLKAYKKVVTTYPNSEEATEALIALKALYILLGKPNEYVKFVEEETGISISVSEQETLLFQSAQEKYYSGDCLNAIDILNEYLSLFPNESNSLEAHFYQADCSFKAKNYQQAFINYKSIVQKGQNKYLEESLLKATYIAYEINKNYQEANNLYQELNKFAALKSNKEIAQIGLMRTYFKLGSNEKTLSFANKVLAQSDINAEVKLEANFYKAKALFESNRLNEAELIFQQVLEEQSTSKIKAESAYLLALIKYKMGSFQESKEDCFFIKNEYASYTYWVVKSFILLADNYSVLNNVFQAKATLKSILNNYNGDEQLLIEAQQKYDELVANELKNTKLDLKKDSTNEIEFDDTENQK